MRYIYALTIDELKEYLKEKSLSSFVSEQIYFWIFKKFNLNLDSWSNIAKKTKTILKNDFSFELPNIVRQDTAKDGTKKFLFQLDDGKNIETVLIPQKNRLTICISSQIGCALGCTFCYSGTQGLERNLTVAEIIGQYLALREEAPITNVVYMGQGEPLLNLDAIKKATTIFLEPKGLMFGQRKITLSTAGLVPQIEKLNDFPPVNIAISLHAAKDDLRNIIMPINRRFNLKSLFRAINKINLKAHRRITYEYLLIDDFNMDSSDIEALVKLIDPQKSKINLIPINESPHSQFKQPSEQKMVWFQRELANRGYTCTIRHSKGDDILAACGQLKSKIVT